MKKITISDVRFLILTAALLALIAMMGCNKRAHMANGCPAPKAKKYTAEPKVKLAYKKYRSYQ